MCGRFCIIDDIDKICQRFNCTTVEMDFQPRFNVAPSQEVPVVTSGQGQNQLKIMRWGLIPYWATDMKIGSRLINARIETISEKPAFRSSFRHRRCIVPASGYFEWQKNGREKIPYCIVNESEELFGMAGLWDRWQNEVGQELLSFSIVTTEAAKAVNLIHNRMPFILNQEQEQLWLDGGSGQDLLHIVKPVENLISYRVSSVVNSPINDLPLCIERIDGSSGCLF